MRNIYKLLAKTLLALAILAMPVLSVSAQQTPVCLPDPEDPTKQKCEVLNPACASLTPEARAQSPLCIDNLAPQAPEDNRIYGPNGIITKVVNILSIVIGIAAVIMIIIGGFKYVLSAGDSSSVNSAKNTILYAVIGLVIAASAQAIIIFVINKL